MSTPSTRRVEGWHVEQGQLARYAAGSLEEAAAWSVEAHVTACGRCRALAVGATAPARLDAIWTGVQDRVDAPRRGLVERGLLALRVPDHLARLLAATPALRSSWLLAVAVVLAAAVGFAQLPDTAPLLFLALAPLVPLGGVAAAFGPRLDPAYEVALAAPLRSSRLLLVRAVAVTATSFALTGVASLALPGAGWTAVAWVLPAFATTAAMLALATIVEPLRAGVGVAVAWVAVVVLAEEVSAVPLAAFQAGGQALALVLALIGAGVALARRRSFDVAVGL